MNVVFFSLFLREIPCISIFMATKAGQLPRVVSDGKHGILLQPSSSKALRNAMLHMIENREKLGPIGTAARERVVELSSNYISLHRAVYQKFILDRVKQG